MKVLEREATASVNHFMNNHGTDSWYITLNKSALNLIDYPYVTVAIIEDGFKISRPDIDTKRKYKIAKNRIGITKEIEKGMYYVEEVNNDFIIFMKDLN
jgi:hypothetical protein